MLSGSSLNSWGLSRAPLDFAKTIASGLGITTSNVRQMVEGLKQVSATRLQTEVSSKYNSVRIYY